MKKTIEVIDLLNKIANKEEIPKKIICDGYEFEFDNYPEDYFCEELNEYLNEYLSSNRMNNTEILNSLIEIIEEEPKKIEKLGMFELTTKSIDDEDLGLELHYTGVSNTFNDVYFKINELIDIVNELKGGKND